MARVIAGTTMSLDGFMADANGSVEQLYSDFAELHDTITMHSAIAQTGAVIMGRKTFEMSDPDAYVGAYEFQVPIFVLTHHPPPVPPRQDERLTFTFVSEGVAAAAARARAAAGNKAIQVVGGASVIRQMLMAGLVDELHIDIMPVLLGDGLRLFEDIDPQRVRLHNPEVLVVGARTGLRFRVGTERGVSAPA
jgi:dihydrofolate reductase